MARVFAHGMKCLGVEQPKCSVCQECTRAGAQIDDDLGPGGMMLRNPSLKIPMSGWR